jgi:large subunit ribosomal protein L21
MSDYAIVESGGQQFRVEKGTTLVVDRLVADEGAKVLLRPVAFRGAKNVVAAGGDLEKVKVEATVAEHLRGPKVRIFKHRPKKGYRRRAGHRQEQTRIEVTEVKMLTRKPAQKQAASGAKAETKPATKKAAPKKAAGAKKPAAKEPAAKKTTTKRSTTRKPAAKKTTTKKDS